MIEFTLEQLQDLKEAVKSYEKKIYGNSTETRFSPLFKIIDQLIDDATPISKPTLADLHRNE